MQRLLRIVALVAVAVAVGLAVLATTTRSRLDDEIAAVTGAWTDTRPALDERYAALGSATDALRDAGGGARAVVGEIDVALARWQDATRGASTPTEADLADLLAAANQLEGLGRRLEATIGASPRFATEPVLTAFAAFAASPVDTDALNERIDRYDRVRGGTVTRVVADVLGQPGLPDLVVTVSAA